MRRNDNLQIVREMARGRLVITKETSNKGSRITICADRMVAILAAALIIVVVAIFK